ncbi:hypothetical protein SynBIOSE41_02770 [Synechococcus sp. BIOS-E4-1]|nr:hypothetical protein SynBIOSE41_02770 [Synechococcus sp. BIOS-E4-1]
MEDIEVFVIHSCLDRSIAGFSEMFTHVSQQATTAGLVEARV